MEDFVQKFKEEMAIDERIAIDTDLGTLDEWDSMGHVVAANFLNEEYNLTVTPEDISNFQTLRDIVTSYNIHL